MLDKSLNRKLNLSLCLIILCFAALLFKIIAINNSYYSQASQLHGKMVISIAKRRGYIYDRNFKLLTNSEQRLVAAVMPTAQSMSRLTEYFTSEEIDKILKEQKPFTVEVSERILGAHIRTFTVSRRYAADAPAVHLIGYTDQAGETGLYGIEKGYNSYLNETGGALSVSFPVDAASRVLPRLSMSVNDEGYSQKGGIMLTIDSSAQEIVQQELDGSAIESGAAIVMHVDTGEIYAMASVPGFDPDNVANAIDGEHSPLLNKCLESYSVGSVIKPLVAATALECGISADYSYRCTGSITVGDTVFSCYNKKAHGRQNMKQALQNSCNTYFISLMAQLDAELLISTLRAVGFESALRAANGIASDAGRLPDESELSLSGQRALLAFGQGGLLASPLQLAAAYHALATGNFVNPEVIYAMVNGAGLAATQQYGAPKKVFTDSTTAILRQLLSLEDINSQAERVGGALARLSGKSGTAQSGIYDGGREVCRTWFCGFFPSDNPHYIVVVFNEDGKSGTADCLPVFEKICDRLTRD